MTVTIIYAHNHPVVAQNVLGAALRRRGSDGLFFTNQWQRSIGTLSNRPTGGMPLPAVILCY